MPSKTPRNQEGQPPTRSPRETAKRLDEKAREKRGAANRARIEEKKRRT